MHIMQQEYPAAGYAPASLEEILRATSITLGRAHGHYKNMLLDSAFQPIFSVSHRRIVGHEGLLRATLPGGESVPPLQVLGDVANDYQSVFLDRLCRTIHLHNYRGTHTDNLWLFLNVSAQVINRRRDHEPFFADLLAHYTASPQKIVVEIVEGVIPDFNLLTEAVEFYREAGCVVAIDDFGAEASDIERIWRASPDIVKLDRNIIVAAEFNRKARRVLQATVALIHEAGSLALLEGVENDDQAKIALDSGSDLVQGFYFAKPAPAPMIHGDGGIGPLADSHSPALRDGLRHQSLHPYILEFKCALQCLSNAQPLPAACAALISMENAELCYMIDADGGQIGSSLRKPHDKRSSRFIPLEDTTGTNWAHKPYHYRAILQPNEVQISRPYLSITSARLCITLSGTFEIEGRLCVLCCDVAWQE